MVEGIHFEGEAGEAHDELPGHHQFAQEAFGEFRQLPVHPRPPGAFQGLPRRYAFTEQSFLALPCGVSGPLPRGGSVALRHKGSGLPAFEQCDGFPRANWITEPLGYSNNRTIWYVIPSGTWTAANTFTGTAYRTTGSPWVGVPYNPGALNQVPAGTVTFTFQDRDNATMSYTVDGVTQSKAITRLPF